MDILIKNEKFADLVEKHGNIYMDKPNERYLQFPFWIKEKTNWLGKKSYFIVLNENLPNDLKIIK